jgi:hypothetical protein
MKLDMTWMKLWDIETPPRSYSYLVIPSQSMSLALGVKIIKIEFNFKSIYIQSIVRGEVNKLSRPQPSTLMRHNEFEAIIN